MKKKAVLFWSGGKDSALALDLIQQQQVYEVAGLVTTLHSDTHRISMHGVRERLLETQALATGIPLQKIFVAESTNEEYEELMMTTLQTLRANGISTVIYGDIYLQDLRNYREMIAQRSGVTAVFPLWRKDPDDLLQVFFDRGFRAVTCCVNDQHFERDDAGKELAEIVRNGFPAGVDPCGENGEFHTFCYDGPVFRNAVNFAKGERIYRPLPVLYADAHEETRGFWYCDLIPV